MKLFYHLYGYLLLGIIALIGVDEYLSFQVEIEQYETEMITNATQLGRSISAMIVHSWRESGEEKALELIRDASESGTIKIRWVWPQTLLGSFTGSTIDKEQLKEVIKGEIVSLKMPHKDNYMSRFTYVPVDLGDSRRGAIELTQTLLPLEAFTKKMFGRAITITIFLALVSGIILYFFINRKIRIPLNSLMVQARRIGEGDLSADNSINGNDELVEMAHTMNDMCSRLLIAKEKINFEYDARLKTLDQLRHTERLSSFGVLSAEIAHELGTPLNVVDGRAKMIISEDLKEEEILSCATIIKNQAERMTNIIRQLLDFTRNPTQHNSREDIAFLIKQVFQLLYPMARKQHVTLVLTKDENTESTLRADFSQLQQVIVNLLMNAIQAMPDGGKVDVNLSNEMLPVSVFEERVKQKYLKVCIQDEGEGVCESNLEHIFTPFFTTKKVGTGTGLGLSIAHGIIEDHEGWIDIENAAQTGACFTIYLPMEEQEK
ncbi:MAG: two-component system NtrC family sensor kinase [Desulforhopalus sp.]|jgi:two-component system NtrC family sensor kinase